jgi:2-oxoglutarate dehydrogenase E2 component (dihydrolipoamide succinyltransferase)
VKEDDVITQIETDKVSIAHCCCCCNAAMSPALAGDTVMEDDVIAQIETDKVTIDVKFTGKGGRISAVLVAEGDTVVVGQAVASVEEGDFGSSSSSPAAAEAEAEAPAAAAAAPAPAAAAAPKPAAAAPPPPPSKPAAPQQVRAAPQCTSCLRGMCQRMYCVFTAC